MVNDCGHNSWYKYSLIILHYNVICRIIRKSGIIRNALKIKLVDPQALEGDISRDLSSPGRKKFGD